MKDTLQRDSLANILGLVVTLGIALLVMIIMIVILSKEPGTTIYHFFAGPLTNAYYLGNMLNAAIPLILTGLGIAVAFRASMFNLGGEGQVYTGGLMATFIALSLSQTAPILGISLALAGAVGISAAIAGLSGFFKMTWNTDELISSFLISNALMLLVDYFITGPLKDPDTNLLTTSKIGIQYRFLKIFLPSSLDISLLFVIGLACLLYFYLFFTHQGYELRITGLNREFALYGGIHVKRYILIPMLISGGLHGLAGAVSILGTHYRCFKGFSAGMGWNGIAVALIAKNHPLGVIPAAIFFAYIEAGAKSAMIHSDITIEIASIVQSIVFFLITAQAIYNFFRYKMRRSYA